MGALIYFLLVLLPLSVGLSGCATFENATDATHKHPVLEPKLSVSEDCDGTNGCFVIDIEIVNSLPRAICLRSVALPIDEMLVEDFLKITTVSGEQVHFQGLTPIIAANLTRAELNFVIAPGKTARGKINVGKAYRLKRGETYRIRYEAPAMLCEIYDFGNPSELVSQDLSKFESFSVSLVSEEIDVTLVSPNAPQL